MTKLVQDILSERESKYGTFYNHADVSQNIQRVMAQGVINSGGSLSKFDPDMLEALTMISTKIGRIVNGDPKYVDSWLDIAGYAQLVADRLIEESAEMCDEDCEVCSPKETKIEVQ